jgi:hypothetical protein
MILIRVAPYPRNCIRVLRARVPREKQVAPLDPETSSQPGEQRDSIHTSSRSRGATRRLGRCSHLDASAALKQQSPARGIAIFRQLATTDRSDAEALLVLASELSSTPAKLASRVPDNESVHDVTHSGTPNPFSGSAACFIAPHDSDAPNP